MQKQKENLDQIMKPIFASSATVPSPFKQLADLVWPLKLHFTLPTPRWAQIFVADQMFRKSFRAAELACWQATGGDFLRSAHAS
jgi:hypothetical protein